MVLDHPVDVGVDAALVALVQALEGTVVPAPDLSDQLVVAYDAFVLDGPVPGCLHERTHVPLHTSEIPPGASVMMTRSLPRPLKARQENSSVQMTDSKWFQT
jgi:hypothetical protein